MLALIRHMQLLHRAAFGAFTASIIAGDGVCLGVPHQLLHSGEIPTGVKESVNLQRNFTTILETA